MKEKQQTDAQRVANPVWLRDQLQRLIASCDEHIKDDQDLADNERDSVRRARYEASIDCSRHYKRQLERILAGKTAAENLAALIDGSENKALRTKLAPCSGCDALNELLADGTIVSHDCPGDGKPPGRMPAERPLYP